ncbi:hypothetical protein L873DRAFT_1819732 [Choiromyces venosus 120613-1]|uniref:CCZ1/INTU/HSP4 first Longin domain-containing protein n=1 Tax=Choiromyces venosus 120613-1 TaxID=1336337 RepID=A0A3N4IYJ8_9PEZI|nr:hypothetical protein L873DRAFT_1819732 [Choiromyces venosus 120613-1]
MTSSSSNAVNPPPAPLPPPSSLVPTISPAILSSLAIYNPSLGPTDETVHDQIVFYTSRRRNTITANDRLRQIGLAQGVVEFARGFSKTQNLSSVETEKSRIVTLEIEEPGWWILAQINLTVSHNPSTYPPTIKYISQEVSPPALLLADIRQAYDQFHFHYGSFASNFARLGRSAFCKRLEKFWLRWAWGRWEVMLHASPATAILGGRGIKMAGGKPGKEMGSEEREFLRGWAEKEKPKGLVDLVASRFGEPPEEIKNTKGSEGHSGFWFWNNSNKPSTSTSTSSTPLQKGQQGPTFIMPQDGCILPGTGTLDSRSVRDVATYLSELYQYGDETFSRPSASSRRKKTRIRPRATTRGDSGGGGSSVRTPPRKNTSTAIPAREEFQAASFSSGPTPGMAIAESVEDGESRGSAAETSPQIAQDLSDKKQSPSNTNAKILNLLTFGWSGGSTPVKNAQARGTDSITSSPAPSSRTPSPAPMKVVDPQAIEETDGPADRMKDGNPKRARFVIGFMGDLDVEDLDESESGGRITSRTIWATRSVTENESDEQAQSDTTLDEGLERRNSGTPTIKQADLEEFRIVIYANHPFILAFIFENSTRHLTSPPFYRTIHHQLAPLYEPMLKFSPLGELKLSLKVPGLLSPILKPPYDILYNPNTRTIHCTLPPIPEPALESVSSGAGAGWSRADAFHVHALILGILSETTGDRSERERSVRSTKGWWVNWMRLDSGVEGIVVRRAGERKVTDVAAGLVGASGTGAGMGGVDIRSYFEGLVRGAK